MRTAISKAMQPSKVNRLHSVRDFLLLGQLSTKQESSKYKTVYDEEKVAHIRQEVQSQKKADSNVSARKMLKWVLISLVAIAILAILIQSALFIGKEWDGKTVNPLVKDFQLSCPDENHPHAIDLGLPSRTKWACCNVGSSKIEDLGYYVVGEKLNNYEVSKHVNGANGRSTEHVKKNNWIIPTKEQCKEILGCNIKSLILNGTKGVEVIGHNQNRIFIPAAGAMHPFGDEYRAWSVGEECTFWTSQKSKKDPFGVLSVSLTYVPDGEEAYANYTTDAVEEDLIIQNCEYALPIRPVINSNDVIK